MRPVDPKYRISRPYGYKSPVYARGYHTGTDFACPTGTTVWSPWDGTVTKVRRNNQDYGNYIEITGEGKKRLWLLAHLSVISVAEGQKVKKKQTVGKSGATGKVTGPHLHAEERVPPFGYGNSRKATAWKNG